MRSDASKFNDACRKGDILWAQHYLPRMKREDRVLTGFNYLMSQQRWDMVLELLPLCTFKGVTGQMLHLLPLEHFEMVIYKLEDPGQYLEYIQDDPEKGCHIHELQCTSMIAPILEIDGYLKKIDKTTYVLVKREPPAPPKLSPQPVTFHTE